MFSCFQLKVGDKVLSVSANVNISELQPSQVYACLQQHISKLQVQTCFLIE